MTVVIELEPEKRVRVYTKGASENLIDDCIKMIDKQDPSVDLDISKREKIKENILKQMARESLRTIGLGYKDISYEEF